MPERILEVASLTKHFGGLRAVHLDLTVDAGELRCLIGPNGAGKSTFFRMLSGAMRPSSGTVRFRGRDITGWDAFRVARLGMSIKFQVASVLEELSVRDNLHLAAEFRFGNRAGQRRAAAMLEVIGLTERADHPATWLSHGEKQWLEMGMTAEEMKKTVRLLKRLNEAATVIVVEHDMNFIRMIAGRVTVMHQGEVFAEGSMEEIERNDGVRDIYLGKGGHYVVRR